MPPITPAQIQIVDKIMKSMRILQTNALRRPCHYIMKFNLAISTLIYDFKSAINARKLQFENLCGLADERRRGKMLDRVR